jgi:hypothetical protein
VPTAGQGAGYGVQDYYSGITKGDGTASIQIQLSGGVSTVYQVTAQITNPTSFAVTQKSQFITVGAGDTQASPHSVSIGF